MFELSLVNISLLAGAATLTGIINGVIGGGSLVSYLALVGLGVPPVQAAVTNTIGVLPGNPAALLRSAKQSRVKYKEWSGLAVLTVIGSLTGGALLISLPEAIFVSLVPLLLLIASVSMFIPLKNSEKSNASLRSGLVIGGLYSGYFGPGQGIITLSLLYRWSNLVVTEIVACKNFIITISNFALSVVFVISDKVVWASLPFLMIFVALGGWIGGNIAETLNPKALRIAVAAAGVCAACYFIFNN